MIFPRYRQEKLSITVIIVTKNEEENLPRCLKALRDFDQILIVDSQSTDQTETIAKQYGADFIPFIWNGQYPKKRQYCLDKLADHIKHQWVFLLMPMKSSPPI